MDLIELTNVDNVEEFSKFYQHIPGWLSPGFNFSINQEEKVYQALLIYPFGKNPKHTTPILAWIEDEGKVYSPEHFFESKLENIWKFPEQTFRFLTLYNNVNNKKVRLNRSVSGDNKDDIPLACFKEDGSTDKPCTYINKETNYGKFIYNISVGNLNEVIEILKENKEQVLIAYPYLKITIENIQKVESDLKALEFFNENKINTIEDILAQKEDLISFEKVSNFFQKLFNKKNKEEEIKYSKGILAIISKSFAYIPRD